ncbi:hypothetical protein ACIBF1_02015 [Spirillospora sp. NPDC050679]
MRTRTRGVLAALPLALMLSLSACGGDDGGKDKVASAPGAKQGGQEAAATAPSDPDDMAVKFTECLRKNGMKVDDPKPGEGMRLKFDGKVRKESVDKAMEACRQFNPQMNGKAGSDPRAQERGRKFAECMRKNGVEKFPDPKPGQVGIMINKDMAEDPDFEKAQSSCKDLMGPGGGPQGGAGQ